MYNMFDVKTLRLNGFELGQKINNKKVKECFITAFQVYYDFLPEIDGLLNRVNQELES
jgi:hypothetical protein